MAVAFPPKPYTVGQQFTGSNNVTYTWDGKKWIAIGTVGAT